jgi:hypothetical protein
MPQPNLIISRNAADLSKVRLPGISKPFEQMTISELANLRPGGTVSDTYDISIASDSITVNTSGHLAELGRIQAEATMRRELALGRIRGIVHP